MSQDLEKHLQTALQRLEKAYEEILKTQGYTRDTEKLKMLVELTREQVRHENTRPHTRQNR
jgi:CRISPR/Cas system-associated endonuclease Cas3-HD